MGLIAFPSGVFNVEASKYFRKEFRVWNKCSLDELGEAMEKLECAVEKERCKLCEGAINGLRLARALN